MSSGRIAEIGPVRDVVLEPPCTPLKKGLMGAIPTVAGGRHAMVQIPGSMPRLVGDPEGDEFQTSAEHAPFDRLPRRPA